MCYALELLQCSKKAKARARGQIFLLYRPKWDLLYGYLVWEIFDNLGGDRFKLFLCVVSNEIIKVWLGTDIMDSCNVYFSETSSS